MTHHPEGIMRSRLFLLSSITVAALTAIPAIASAQRITRDDRFYDRRSYTRYDIDERIERAQRRALERAARAQERARDRSARAYASRLRIGRDRGYLLDERMTRMRDRIEAAEPRGRWRVRW
jgi:hypothetical protein